MHHLNANHIKSFLFQSIDSLLKSKEKFLFNPDKAFSRVQKISFRDTMLYPMIVHSESTPVEMLDFFPESDMPSAPALSYRRDQIKVEAFETLFSRFTSHILGDQLFHGMRLIACDGSRLSMPYNPKDELSYVKNNKGHKGFNQLHLNTCYDLLNDCYTDAVIQGYYSMDEQQAFCQMMKRYKLDTSALFIADRGYFSYNVLAHAFDKDHFFLIRAKSSIENSLFPDFDGLKDLDSFDVTDEINIVRRRTKESKALRNSHFIPKNRTYDFITSGDNQTDTFRVRLLKFPVSETSTEYIVTNLPEDQFPQDVIKKLYRMRWGIETSFRFLKYADGLLHIHSLKETHIYQEIFAKLTTYNFCSAVNRSIEDVESVKENKYKYVYNKSYLIKICVRFLKGKIKDPKSLIRRKKEAKRDERQSKRDRQQRRIAPLQGR